MKKISVAFIFTSASLIDSLATLVKTCLIHPAISTTVYAFASTDKRLPDHGKHFLASQKIVAALAAHGIPASSAILNEKGYEADYAATNIDVVFPQTPYEEYKDYKLGRFIRQSNARICYVPYSFMLSKQTAYHYHLDFYEHCWKIFVECNLRHDIFARERGKKFAERVIVSGMPRIDSILAGKNQPLPMNYWNYPIDRWHKRILWAPHHSFTWSDAAGKTLPGYAQFHIYAKSIRMMAEQNPELDIAIRPHPLMWGTMVQNKFMTAEQLSTFREYLFDLPNLRLDDGNEYISAFWSSDALITDGVSFLGEYLLVDRPVFYLENPNGPGLNEWGNRLVAGYYKILNPDDLWPRFKQVIGEGLDSLREKRQKACDDLFMPPEGASAFIVNHILESLEAESRVS